MFHCAWKSSNLLQTGTSETSRGDTNKGCFFFTIQTYYFSLSYLTEMTRHRCFWHATQDCVVPDIDSNLHRGRFWAMSTASGSVRLWHLRSCWMVLSHVMRGVLEVFSSHPVGRANKTLLASALSSMRAMQPHNINLLQWNYKWYNQAWDTQPQDIRLASAAIFQR